MSVNDVWGIGRRISKKLELMNVKTAYDLAKIPAGLARKQFSIEIERTVRELNGQACKVWDEARAETNNLEQSKCLIR